MSEEKRDKKNDAGALFIPGGLLLGLGIGIALGNPGAGLLIGLGGGFMLWALLSIIRPSGN
ncbi:MAG: hypothetical protein U0526_03035 [Candidatus Saccharibacteria bacterium]